MLVYGTDQSLPSVPRSKGCLNCVSRKTRCDGRRPTCRVCENRKQACGGYRRDQFVFLSEGWRPLGVASKPRAQGDRVRPSEVNRSTCQSDSALPISNSPTRSPTCPETDVSNGNRLAVCPSPSMDRSHLHIAYFLASFGTRPSQALGSLGHLFRHYLPMVSPNVYHDHESSSSSITPVVLAVDALAYSHFGTANADAVSVRWSYHMYGIALRSMSVKLAKMNLAEPGLYDMSDDEWQHFAFFCLVMAFWEMKMSPASSNWEKHLRCLAEAILVRGTDHVYSRTNLQLLASSRLLLTLQTLSAREPNDWQYSSPIRSAWLDEVKSALGKAEDPKLRTDYELYHSIDSLMTDVTTIVSTMAQFDQLFTSRSATCGLDSQDSTNRSLIDLYDKAEYILSQNEARLARWNANVCEISLSSWLSLHQDMTTDPISGCFWSSMNEPDVQSCFDTVLTFRTMLEYHSITLYWTIIMSLRLLLSDMLTFMLRTNVDGMPSDSRHKIEDHRTQLMKYALNVLQTICYATHTESRAVGPFVFATAFQLAVAVLERERKFLQAATGGSQDNIRRCDSLKSLAVRYLDWAMQNKIPVKIDLSSLKKWEFASTA